MPWSSTKVILSCLVEASTIKSRIVSAIAIRHRWLGFSALSHLQILRF
ncbi:MAG: hypothetical protein QXI39_07910 [Candidatus Bathyarchaeia archaeon]